MQQDLEKKLDEKPALKWDAQRARNATSSWLYGIGSGMDIFGFTLGIGDKKHIYLGYQFATNSLTYIPEGYKEYRKDKRYRTIFNHIADNSTEENCFLLGLTAGAFINLATFFTPAFLASLYNLGYNVAMKFESKIK